MFAKASGQPLVTVVQRVVPHYRVDFFRQLHERLCGLGIRFELLYGQDADEREAPLPELAPSWAKHIRNHYVRCGSAELVWQSGVGLKLSSDLIVVEQANRLLANFLLQLRRRREPFRLAFWGHGRNMQSRNSGGLSERLKQQVLTQVDWWFAYTESSRAQVEDAGFPRDRITVVNNTIDDVAWRKSLSSVRADAAAAMPREHVGLFCGTLHKDKRLSFLLRAARSIRERVPDFELIIVGDGPDRAFIADAAARHPWIRYVGHRTGAAKAALFDQASVLLMPGLVGLVVVDSFIAGVPLITTDYPYHSPEICYLRQGVNGLSTANDTETYALEVVRLLQDRQQLAQMRQACLASAQQYTLCAMVDNLVSGVESCLDATARQSPHRLKPPRSAGPASRARDAQDSAAS